MCRGQVHMVAVVSLSEETHVVDGWTTEALPPDADRIPRALAS